MAAAESKDAAIPPEGGPPPGERLRLPAGEGGGPRVFVRGAGAVGRRLDSVGATARFLRPNGPPSLSPGQRPGSQVRKDQCGLKGRATQSLTGIDPRRCEVCGQKALRLVGEVAPARAPRAPPR